VYAGPPHLVTEMLRSGRSEAIETGLSLKGELILQGDWLNTQALIIKSSFILLLFVLGLREWLSSHRERRRKRKTVLLIYRKSR